MRGRRSFSRLSRIRHALDGDLFGLLRFPALDQFPILRIMTKSKTVRVGVLGAGAWARFAHLPGYKRDQRSELVAIADPVVERAKEFAHEFGIPDAYDSHEALLA